MPPLYQQLQSQPSLACRTAWWPELSPLGGQHAVQNGTSSAKIYATMPFCRQETLFSTNKTSAGKLNLALHDRVHTGLRPNPAGAGLSDADYTSRTAQLPTGLHAEEIYQNTPRLYADAHTQADCKATQHLQIRVHCSNMPNGQSSTCRRRLRARLLSTLPDPYFVHIQARHCSATHPPLPCARGLHQSSI